MLGISAFRLFASAKLLAQHWLDAMALPCDSRVRSRRTPSARRGENRHAQKSPMIDTDRAPRFSPAPKTILIEWTGIECYLPPYVNHKEPSCG